MKNQDRVETLVRITGLEVTRYEQGGVQYFVFGDPSQPLKSVCTYQKAKIFAEGYALGKQFVLETTYHE